MADEELPNQKKRPTGTPKQQTDERHDLHKAADNAKDVLIRAESIFPFNLFPDTISVSRMKVAITRRSFFKVAEVVSLQHDDILNVEADTGPFLGAIKIYTRIYGSEPLRITFLSRKSTVDVKRIIEGFIIAHKQNIEYNDLDTEELRKLLNRLGSDAALT
jgi:hypothetical protein